MTTTQTTHHHRGGQAPTRHAPARGGPRTNTARPTRGEGTHQHSTNPGQANTTDNQHRQCRPYGGGDKSEPTKPARHQPATTPRNETRTRRHSTPHHGGGHAQTRHAPTGEGARTSTTPTAAKPTTQPHTTAAAGRHRHGTPQQEGGHAPTQHAPPGGRARTSTAPTPARQTPQTTNTRQCRPYGGEDKSEPSKPAGHPAGYNTTNSNPNTTTQHAPPRGGARTNTAHPNRGWGTHQHNTNPSQPNNTTATTTHPTDDDHPNHTPPPRGGPRTNTARPTTRGATHQRSKPHHGRGGHIPTQPHQEGSHK